MLRLTSLVLGLLVTSVIVYEAGRTLIARANTPATFEHYLSSDAVKIRAGDLAHGWLDILLKVEDPGFLGHHGIDMKTPGAGLTTITQGIVKQFYFKEFKPGWRKLEQSLIARFAVHPLISKEDQLTVFLNSLYMGQCDGREVTGFADAATCYYKRPFADLSEDEYIGLVAMAVGPNGYNPASAPGKHAERVRRIKALLAGNCVPLDNGDVYYRAC